MTFPTVQSQSNGSDASTFRTSHTVSMPSGIVAGDLILIFFGNKNAPGTIASSGFSSLGTDNNGTNSYLTLLYKTADGSEGASVTVTTTSSIKGEWVVYRVSGWQGTPEKGTATTGSATAPDSPSLSPSWGADDTLWFSAFTTANSVAETGAPTNYSNLQTAVSSASGSSAMACAERQLNASSEDPGAFGSNWANWVAQTFAIRPGTASQTVTPGLFTDGDTFFAPTVLRGPRILSPTLVSLTNTFGMDKIIYILHAPSYSDPDTFYPVLVANALLVKPDRFQNQIQFEAFNSNYTVYGNRYDDPDTFYSPNAIRLLKPTLLLDEDTFYTPVVYGFFSIRPDLYVDPDTFGVPKIVYTIYPTRDENLQTFYNPSLTAFNQLSPTRYIDPDVFYSPITHGSYNLFPTHIEDPDIFYDFFSRQFFSPREKPFRFQRYSNLNSSGAPIYTTLRKFRI